MKRPQTPVPPVCLPVSLTGPDPSGSTGPTRLCRGCFPPSPPSRGSGCRQLYPATTMAKASKVLHLQPENLRLVAHLNPYRKFSQAEQGCPCPSRDMLGTRVPPVACHDRAVSGMSDTTVNSAGTSLRIRTHANRNRRYPGRHGHRSLAPHRYRLSRSWCARQVLRRDAGLEDRRLRHTGFGLR
jgi:hypothetical protein